MAQSGSVQAATTAAPGASSAAAGNGTAAAGATTAGIKCTPCEAMFGLKTSSFPNDSIEHLRTEEELRVLIKTVNNPSENTNSEIKEESEVNSADSSQNDPPSEVTFETQKKKKKKR
ncbi:hypothetical protein CDAR_108531 [Caerostris darwini]|uniref:Uncharacterized protein n=1 Tax=Caerostris darwini TaxID=1538125 RepID=A0AAV4SDW4_9ARAC|nr:hypothetical protein CDAR_108531 [Caerostris darwini]